MANPRTIRSDAHNARVMLRMIQRHRHSQAASARERVLSTMADLDLIILRLPEDPPQDLVDEVERIVSALRNADVRLADGDSRAGMLQLDLASARLRRLADRLPPPPVEPLPEPPAG